VIKAGWAICTIMIVPIKPRPAPYQVGMKINRNNIQNQACQYEVPASKTAFQCAGGPAGSNQGESPNSIYSADELCPIPQAQQVKVE
jgi:hypothetical protein